MNAYLLDLLFKLLFRSVVWHRNICVIDGLSFEK